MTAQGSLDIVSRQRLLSKALYEACIELCVPEDEHDELVVKGHDKFAVSGNGKVKPIGQWPSIKSFINARGLKVLQPKTPAINTAELRAKRKAQLFDLLCFYADAGDVAGYRMTRAEYALL